MRPSGTRYTLLTEEGLRSMYSIKGMSPKEILLVAAGYLIGSLSFAFLLVRWKTGPSRARLCEL